MPELGTSGSVRDRDGKPPGLLDRGFSGKALRAPAASPPAPLSSRPPLSCRGASYLLAVAPRADAPRRGPQLPGARRRCQEEVYRIEYYDIIYTKELWCKIP